MSYSLATKRASSITIPTRGVGPHVKLIFAEMQRQGTTYADIAWASGVEHATLKAWRTKNAASLNNLTAVLGVLGYDFVPMPRADKLDKALVADLKEVAARHGLELQPTVQALIEIVSGIYDRPIPEPTTRPVVKRERSRRVTDEEMARATASTKKAAMALLEAITATDAASFDKCRIYGLTRAVDRLERLADRLQTQDLKEAA